MDSKRYFLPLALVLSLLCVSGSKRPSTLVSFHIEAEAAEAEVDSQGKFILPLRLGNPPTTYYFRKVPELTSKQVEGFYAFPSRTGTGFGAAFKLDPQGRNRLLSVTSSNSGKRLLTTVNTRPVNFVIIDKAISHGYIVVWSGLNEDDIVRFRKDMTEIVPNQPSDDAQTWDASDAPPENAEEAGDEGGKKRGFFGRLFKGKDKKGEDERVLELDSGSSDDFAPAPN